MNKVRKIAICVIGYNRPDTLHRVLKSISQADYNGDEVDLNISIDKSDVREVLDCADTFIWQYGKKTVWARPDHMGLRAHILSCGDLLEIYDALIVLEDDIYVSEGFYIYAKECVYKFADEENIAGISLYRNSMIQVPHYEAIPFIPLQSDSDVYLVKYAQSWGQVWMRRQWFAFKQWYEKNKEEFTRSDHLPDSICSWNKSSWLKYHIKYCIEENKYFVYPYLSLCTCFNEIGQHTKSKKNIGQVHMLSGVIREYRLHPTVRYDGFFENECLAKYLGVKEENLCVDFFCQKRNRLNYRYVLTRDCLPYKIVRSYALCMRPYELNVIYGIEGNELFLYDTSGTIPKSKDRPQVYFLQYMFNFISYRNILKNILLSILHK